MTARTIGFFSFKGGLGRTQSLINLGALLAQKGKFVVVVDLDLHAPGLSLMDSMLPAPGEIGVDAGILHFLEALVNQDDRVPDLAEIAYRPSFIDRNLDTVRGDLQFVPLFPFEPDHSNFDGYSEVLQKLEEGDIEKWQKLLNARQSQPTGTSSKLLDLLKDQLMRCRSDRFTQADKAPDYILIDARTGFTEVSQLVLTDSCDHVVVLAGVNQQNREGLRLSLGEIAKTVPPQTWPHKLTVVISPVPDSEESLKKAQLDKVKGMLESFATVNETYGAIDYDPEVHFIPYHPQLALTDDILTLEYPDARPVDSYRRLYERLESSAKHIGQVTQSQLSDLLPQNRSTELGETDLSVEMDREHPLVHYPKWNAFFPTLSWKDLLPESAASSMDDCDIFLNYFSQSQSLSYDEKIRVVESFPRVSGHQFRELHSIFADERTKFLSLPAEDWDGIAGLIAGRICDWVSLLEQKSKRDPIAPNSLETLTFERIQSGAYSASKYPSFWVKVAEQLATHSRARAVTMLEAAAALLPQSATIALALADHYYFSDRDKDAINLADTLIRKYQAEANKQSEAHAHRIAARSQLVLSDLDQAEISYQNALILDKKAESKLGMANDSKGLGDVYLRRAELEKAEKAYQDAFELYKLADSKLGMANDSKGLGDVYLRRGELEKAEKAYQDAFELHKLAEDKLGMANDSKGLGDVYLRRDELEKAEKAYQDAFELHKLAEDKLGMANDSKGLAKVRSKSGNHPEAENQLTELISTYQDLQDKEGEAETLQALGDHFVTYNDLPKAADYYHQAQALATKMGHKLLAREIDEALSAIS